LKLKDRIKGLERIPARDLLPHPKNWRTHPREQRDALRGILADVGIADALLVRRTKDGYQILDGHCRAEEAPDVEWPCLVVDLSDVEADKLLATHDPIGAMAEADADTLRELLAGVESENEAVQRLLGAISVDVLDHMPADDEQCGSGSNYGIMQQTSRERLVWGDIEVALPTELYDEVRAACESDYTAGGSYATCVERLLKCGLSK
jgi:hypothetical protein